MKQKYFYILYAILLVFNSCQKEVCENDDSFESKMTTDLSSYKLPVSQIPLFADLSKYNLLSDKTVTRAAEEEVSLESLLNRNASKTISFKGATLMLIPFLQNEEEVLACIGGSPEEGLNNATCVKKYYVATANESYAGSFVVSMITGYQYYQTHPMFDYFDMPNYTGAILYSTLDGELKETRVYKGGRILQSEPIIPGIEQTDSTEIVYITLCERATETRQDWNDYITASICTGLGVKHEWGWINSSWCFGLQGGSGGGSGNDGNPLTGGGSGNGNDQQSADGAGGALLPNLPPIGIESEIKVYSNIPDYVTMLGSGTYPCGSQISIEYELTTWVYREPEFSYWTGTFENYKEPKFLYTVTCDAVSTAYFENPIPCGNREKGVTNPLKEMRIAATKSGSYVNGTFNAFRGYKANGSPKYHKGVDFYAEEGTSTYAMFSGKIVCVKTEAPAKESRYNGGYGNIITIECDVYIDPYNDDGIYGETKTFYLQYSHLQAGNPVAINPRTGEYYKVGDAVFRGDLIGFTGRTGNAYEGVPNPHLHLGASFEMEANGRIPPDKWIDVMPYINGTIDMEQLANDFGKQGKGQLNNIECN